MKGALAFQKAHEREDRTKKVPDLLNSQKKMSNKKFNLVANSKLTRRMESIEN